MEGCGKPFVVVEFTDEKSIGAVPLKWLINNNTQCQWPARVTPAFSKVRKDPDSTPEENWSSHNCRVLGRFGNYTTANSAAIRAEDTSEIEQSGSEGAKGRRRRKTKLITSSSSESDVSPKKSKKSTTQCLQSLVPSPIKLPENDFLQVQNTLDQSSASDEQSNPNDPSIDNLQFVSQDALILSGEGLQLGESQSYLITPEGILQALPRTVPVTPVTPGGSTPSSGNRNLNVPHVGFNRVLLKHLANIERNQTHILGMLHTIQANIVVNTPTSSTSTVFDFSSFPRFPLQTPDQLTDYNNQLELDTERELLIEYLAGIGGDTVALTVKGILNRIFGSELALNLSYTGRGSNNISFVQYKNVNTAIVVATQRNEKLTMPMKTESIIKKKIMDFFRFYRPVKK